MWLDLHLDNQNWQLEMLRHAIDCPASLLAGSDGNEKSKLAVIGSWSMQVKLLSLPDLKTLVTQDLGSEVIPRSVALADFEGQVRST